MSRTEANTPGTYTLEEGLERIVSPVNVIFPDRSMKKYKNGTELAADTFARPYTIRSFAAVDNEIGIILDAEEE